MLFESQTIIRQLKAENKELKNRLESLTSGVLGVLNELDKATKEKEGSARGHKLATIANELEYHNDSAMHFGLGYSFERIKKLKKKDLDVHKTGGGS